MTAYPKPSQQVRDHTAKLRRQTQAANRATIVERFWHGQETAQSAAAALGVTVRQFWCIRKRYANEGIDGLHNRHAGKPSNRRLPNYVRKLVLLIAEGWQGATPTDVHRQLQQHYGYTISLESVRAWMIASGHWQLRRPSIRMQRIHAPTPWHRWLRSLASRCCVPGGTAL